MPLCQLGFSPVAGIQWVETMANILILPKLIRFSPVAGIQWVETVKEVIKSKQNNLFQSRCRDSVG